MSRDPQDAGSAPRGVLIRAMEPADAGQVLAIYQAGLDTGQASFETTAPAWEHFDAARLPAHRHVAWEVYTVKGDADILDKEADSACCAPGNDQAPAGPTRQAACC